MGWRKGKAETRLYGEDVRRLRRELLWVVQVVGSELRSPRTMKWKSV